VGSIMGQHIGEILVCNPSNKLSNPLGSFNNGFKGICSVFVTAAFSFAGTELAGLAAAETVSHSLDLSTNQSC
jgi:amino acid permease